MTPTADDLPPRAEVIVEVPRGGRIKRASDGTVDYVSPVGSPFNYGSVPAVDGADGEPLDALVLGPRLPRGDRRTWPVHGIVYFIDENVRDDKIVCGPTPPTEQDLQRIHRFFTRYARLKAIWAVLRGRGVVRFVGWEPRS